MEGDGAFGVAEGCGGGGYGGYGADGGSLNGKKTKTPINGNGLS